MQACTRALRVFPSWFCVFSTSFQQTIVMINHNRPQNKKNIFKKSGTIFWWAGCAQQRFRWLIALLNGTTITLRQRSYQTPAVLTTHHSNIKSCDMLDIKHRRASLHYNCLIHAATLHPRKKKISAAAPRQWSNAILHLQQLERFHQKPEKEKTFR